MSRKFLQLIVLAGCLLPLLGAGSCGVKETERLPPEQVRLLRTASLEELLADVERRAAAIHSINAQTELRPATGSAYSGVIEQYHDVKVFVLATRGAGKGNRERRIRLIGQAPIVRKTVFDMVADEQRFRIYIPTRNKFLVGPTELEQRSEKPIENLRPQHIFEALFPAAPLAEAVHLREENLWGGTRYYGINELLQQGGRLRLHRRWWFEREQLELVRLQRFDAEGHLLADVHYSRWQRVENVPYPHRIELVRPHDDYRVTILVKEITLNEVLGPEKFVLKQPRGAELVKLEKEPGRGKPEAEPEPAREREPTEGEP